jgi:phosphoglycolate phosphatase
MLRDLARSGIWLAVVSNKTGKYLRREVAHLGWEGHFARVVGATDASADKPATAPVDLALEGSDLTRGRDVWFVGDAAIDLECARNSGCVAVLLRSLIGGDPEEFATASPDYRFTGCKELHALVRRWGIPHI